MVFHRITKGWDKVPQLGEVVLIVGEERNRGKWMKGIVLRCVKGKDGVIREAIVLHKGNRIERPIQLLCPLEIKSPLRDAEGHNAITEEESSEERRTRKKRQAARDAELRIKECLKHEDE